MGKRKVKLTDNPAEYDLFLSSGGSDANNGTSYATPKLTWGAMSALATANKRVLILQGSLHRETFGALNNGLKIKGQAGTTPTISGADVITGWVQHDATNYPAVWSKTLNTNIPIAANYNHAPACEIDQTLEITQPFTARKYLVYQTSIDLVAANIGSAYYNFAAFPNFTIYINVGGNPNTNGKRYEVASRLNTVDNVTLTGLTVKNMILRACGHGYGPLAVGDNTIVENVVIQGGGIHHGVVRSGRLTNILFLPGITNAGSIGFVFYNPTTQTNEMTLQDSTFMDLEENFYCHTSGGAVVNTLISLTRVKVFGKSDLTSINSFSFDNTTTINVTDCAAVNTANFISGLATNMNYTRLTAVGLIKFNTINTNSDNLCIINIQDSFIQTDNRTGIIRTGAILEESTIFKIAQPSNQAIIQHSILWAKSSRVWNDYVNVVFQNTTPTASSAKSLFDHNIVIIDVPTASGLSGTMVFNTRVDSGTGARDLISDYNVYIMLSGDMMYFTCQGSPFNAISNTNATTALNTWKTDSLQDAHSIVIDLRGVGGGLNNVFVDPANGNFTLLAAGNTYADQIRAVGAGKITSMTAFPQRPASYEAAAAAVLT